MIEDPVADREPVADQAFVKRARQPIGAALASALIPGIGQFTLGEIRKSWIFLSLGMAWILLFFPPFRLPAHYTSLLFLLFSGIALSISASWQSLRSHAAGRAPASYWWLLFVLPLAILSSVAVWSVGVRLSGFRLFKIPSTSMEKTIQQGDNIIADMRCYRHRTPAREDVLIFKRPNEAGVTVVKRLIAVGGDTIRSIDGQIYLNGKVLNEPYAQHSGGAPEEMMNFGPTVIPPHKLFVMGDNRDVSLDSRMTEFGLVDESAVLGKPLYIFKAGNDRTGKPIP